MFDFKQGKKSSAKDKQKRNVIKKILIIGGCGYVGSALYKYLTKNYAVDTLDLEWYGNFVNKDNIVSVNMTWTNSQLSINLPKGFNE